MNSLQKEILTIGHSTRSIQEFIDLLKQYQVKEVVDVRSFPGSRKFPWFNKENLPNELSDSSISYCHLPLLGGRRKGNKGSHNTRWHNASFRNYADYMETDDFKKGIQMLTEIAMEHRVAYMCSEAVWWRCHRSMISDYLKLNGWTVFHILSQTNLQEHPYTSPARIEGNKLYYCEKEIFE